MKMSGVIAIILVLVAAVAAFVFAQNRGQASGAAGGLETYENLAAALADPQRGVILVDVRTAAEYESGHIPGAVNIPHTEIGQRPPTADKDATIVLYCRSGNRSGIALQILQKLGYRNLANFGAVTKWKGAFGRGPEAGTDAR